MNLPTWEESKAEENPLQKFVLEYEPGSPHEIEWRERLQAALDFVVAPRSKKDGVMSAPTKKSGVVVDGVTMSASQRALPQIRFDPPNDPTILRPAECAMPEVLASLGAVEGEDYPAEMYRIGPLPAAGILEKRLAGRIYDQVGKPADIVSFSNPRGDVIASRMTKLTGVIHYVDVKDGQVKSMGVIPAEAMAAAAATPVEKYDEATAIASVAAALGSGEIRQEGVKPT